MKKERTGKGTFEEFKDNIHRDVIGELKSHEGGEQGEEEEENGEELGEEEEEGEEHDLDEVEEEPLVPSPRAAQVQSIQQPPISSRPSQGNQDDDSQFDGSENFSMDANTAGTSSNKGDDLDDISSFGANENTEDVLDENFDDLLDS